MNCPNCNIKLHMTQRNDVEIDYCPDCRGVWLDRGELDKIIERSSISAPPTSNPSLSGLFGKSDNRQGYGTQGNRPPQYYKKKESFIEKLFDF